MAVVYSLQELTVRAVADGWDRGTRSVPVGDRNMHDYFDFSNQIDAGDVLTYDFANDHLAYPGTYTQAQRQEVNNCADLLKEMYDKFMDTNNTIVVKDGFQLEAS